MQKVKLEDLGEIAHAVLAPLALREGKSHATLIALQGELGAGKTTFVQALAKELGVEGVVNSPTYVLMKKYEIPKESPFKSLIHIDAYRLESPQEFATLKPAEFLQDPTNLVVIEWPEKLGNLLPTADVTLKFSSSGAGEGERYIEVTHG